MSEDGKFNWWNILFILIPFICYSAITQPDYTTADMVGKIWDYVVAAIWVAILFAYSMAGYSIARRMNREKSKLLNWVYLGAFIVITIFICGYLVSKVG